jgi:hypothetical protein
MSQLQYIQTIKDIGEELNHYIDREGQRLSTFGPISGINILIGPTNSGKSRFIRGLFRSPHYVRFLLDPHTPNPNIVLNLCTSLSRQEFHILIVVNPESREYDSKALTIDSPWLRQQLQSASRGKKLESNLTPHDFRAIRGQLEQDLGKSGDSTQAQRRRIRLSEFVQQYRIALRPSDYNTADCELLRSHLEGLTPDIMEDIETVLGFIDALPSTHQHTPPQKVYIPVLRTAAFLRGISTSDTTDHIAQAISANYGLDQIPPKSEVFTGNLLYSTIQEERSRDPGIHRRLKEFQRFLGRAFFEGLSVELKPLSTKAFSARHLALLIDERIQREFHNIGDGIQAIIILMYRLFTSPKGTWVFIEEPERGLHPGLQRIFLDTLAHDPVLRGRELTIFMATHSNHILGMAISEIEDVSVFAFQRWLDHEEQFQVRPVHTPEHNLLKTLGVANSSVFLANCGVWVEGITDRMYLRAYLDAWLKSDEFKKKYSFVPQEDIHYAFFEYAGSNLAHYLFGPEDALPTDYAARIHAQFLCNRIFLVADKDRGRQKRHNALKAVASQSASFEYHVTPGIEVENLVSDFELSQILPDFIQGITQEDVAKAGIQLKDYRNERLGTYLKKTFGELCPDAVKAQSGTLNTHYKQKLPTLVCSRTTWETMSKDAQELIKRLYKFIRRHNQIVPQVS